MRAATSQSCRWMLIPTLALVALTAACVTINVYFPEAAIKDLSEQIEDAVAQEAAKTSEEAADSNAALVPGAMAPSSLDRLRAAWLPRILNATAGTVAAQPGVAAPEISNPAIRKIVESRGARLDEIQTLKASGVVGENREALLEARDLSSLRLKERAQAQRLIKAENTDRERMFKEIAAATGVDLSTLPRIRRTYAATLRANARKGDWLQAEDGAWSQK